mmetsp:Transcript_53267/g.126780  ORF Transcript_53267/g.126780 Transcript_53267/m.126780 type:complete len:536 (-) Transcript_53267:1329-2936(-)
MTYSAPERPGSDLEGVLAEPLSGDETFQLGLDQGLAVGVVAAEGREHGSHARGQLGVEGIDLKDAVAEPRVARPVLGVEMPRVARERADQRPALVGVLHAEIGVGEQLVSLRQRIVRVRHRLHGEVLAEDEVVALGVLLVEVIEGGGARGVVRRAGKLGGSRDAIGHASCREGLVEAHLDGLGVLEGGEEVEARVLDAPFADSFGVVAEGCGGERRCRIRRLKLGAEGGSDGALGELERRHQRIRVDGLHRLAEGGEGRETERDRAQRRVRGGVREDCPDCLHQKVGDGHVLTLLGGLRVCQKRALEQHLASLPLVEGVGIVGHEERQLLLRSLDLQLHRRAEAAEEREDRLLGDPFQHEVLLGLVELKNSLLDELLAVLAQQPGPDGDEVGSLVGLVGRRAARLLERHGELLGARVVEARGLHGGRSRLGVPALELREVTPARVGHGRAELVARHCGAVVALEVEIETLAEAILAEQGLVHADHLSALVVHRRRVEVVHGDVRLRADRVRHRAVVLGELGGAEDAHVVDALHGL